jgi:hypothetical protein
VTTMVYLTSAALLILALRHRPQAITVTLAAGWVIAVMAGEFTPRANLMPLLLTIDAGVVVVMAQLARRYRSDRARIVMALGLLKVTMGIALAGGVWNAFAAAYNAAFLAQVLVAGGLSDGVTSWLGYRLRGLCSRVSGMLGYFHGGRA